MSGGPSCGVFKKGRVSRRLFRRIFRGRRGKGVEKTFNGIAVSLKIAGRKGLTELQRANLKDWKKGRKVHLGAGGNSIEKETGTMSCKKLPGKRLQKKRTKWGGKV